MSTRLYAPSTKISVRRSRGKGLGVFATKRIRAGEVIETAPVLVVPKGQVNKLATSFLGHYMFQTDSGKHMALGLGFTSMINHSEHANAEFFVSIERIMIKALRAIPADTEITVDYGWSAAEWESIGISYPPSS